MTAASINRAANDPQLRARVDALTQKEVIYNEALADTWFGEKVRSGMAAMSPLYWAVAVASEAQYETALNNGRGAPGHDVDVIPDGAITAAINAHWPEEPAPPTAPATQMAPPATGPIALGSMTPVEEDDDAE